MKRLLGETGYTIIEVMIVLAVSGGLLASVATMISGQQRRTEFSIATRELESKIQDVFNDVETGVISNNGQLKCTVTGAASPVIENAGPGVSGQCIFVGKAIQFYKDSAGLLSQYGVINVVGRREYEDADGKIRTVTSLENAKTVPFYIDGSSKNTVDTGSLVNGLQLSKIRYYKTDGTYSADTTSLVVIGQLGVKGEASGTTFGSDGGARIGNSGFNDVNATQIHTNFLSSLNTLTSNSFTPVTGAIFCFNEGPGGRVSAVAVGLRLNAAGNAVESTGQRTKTDAYFDNQAQQLGCSS